MTMRGRTLRRLVLLLIPTALAASWLLGSAPGSWVDVQRGPISVRIDVEGTLQADASRQYGPPATPGMWEFKIAFMAPDGTNVSEGERIVAFDTSELEQRLQKASAELQSARSEIEKKTTSTTLRQREHSLRLEEARGKLAKAELKLDRPPDLVAKKEIAELELDRRVAQREVEHLETTAGLLDEADAVELAILESQRDNASRRTTELRAAIERMTMRAPRDGTVIHLSDRRGEKKRVGDAAWMRDKVLSLPDLSRMSAEGLVDEADAGRLTIGQPVELRLDAHPEVTFSGRVQGIAKTVQPRTRNSPLRVVRVDIALDETDPTRMRPEMRFRGTIEVERHEDVLLAPLSAIRQSPDGAHVERRRLLDGEDVPVSLGVRNDEIVEIVSGLSAGDSIRASGEQR